MAMWQPAATQRTCQRRHGPKPWPSGWAIGGPNVVGTQVAKSAAAACEFHVCRSSPKDVASSAKRRAGLVIPLVDMASSSACCAVRARRFVRRRVATCACRMPRRRVKGRQCRRRVAGGARGCRGDAAGAVRAMARRAATGNRPVGLLGLLRMARGAGRSGNARVRFMATYAALVAVRRGLFFGGVAGAAGYGLRNGVHDRRAVARRAIAVARVRSDERRLVPVAIPA
jgi:hypothetical protein